MTVVYYYLGDAPDVDNIVKPIQDALCGVVIEDDSRVLDVHSAKRDLEGPFKVAGMSQVLAEGFVAGSDFVYIRVDEALPQQELL